MDTTCPVCDGPKSPGSPRGLQCTACAERELAGAFTERELADLARQETQERQEYVDTLEELDVDREFADDLTAYEYDWYPP